MKPRVLIIDDEEAIRSSLKMIFEYEGYECLLAANGPAGLKIAEREAPDLVFLDIKMPQMDGMEVLKRLKARTRLAPGRDPLRPRHREDRGRGHQARRLRLHREAARRASASCSWRATRSAQKRLARRTAGSSSSFDERYRMVGESAGPREGAGTP